MPLTLEALRKNVNRSLNELAHESKRFHAAQSNLEHWERLLADRTNKRDKFRALATARYNAMSEHERLAYWVCDRKKVYAFERDAKAFQTPDSGLRVYSCVFCSGYHAGHPPRGNGLNPTPKSIIFAMMYELGYR